MQDPCGPGPIEQEESADGVIILGTAREQGSAEVVTEAGVDRPVSFRFDAQQGHWYHFSCAAASASQCRLQLLDASGTVRMRGTRDSEFVEYFLYRATSSGPFFISVSGSAGRFSYKFSARAPDDHEAEWNLATPVTDNLLIGTLSAAHDVDFFAVPTQAGHTYRISCGEGEVTNVRLTLHDSVGRPLEIAMGDNGSVFALTRLHPASTTGTLYVSLKTVYSLPEDFAYRCTVEDLGADDHGDSQETATALAASTVGTGWLGLLDSDYFALPLKANHFYRQSFTSTATSFLSAYGRSPSGSQLPYYANSPIFLVETTGTAYFAIRGSEILAYTLLIEDLGADDHADKFGVATPITVGALFDGVVTADFDQDTFTFESVEGQAYRFNCDVPTPGVSVNASISTIAPGWEPLVVGTTRTLEDAGLDLPAGPAQRYWIELGSPVALTRYQCRIAPVVA